MITLKNQTTCWFDCDDTLVNWSATPEELEKYGIAFTCPASSTMIDGELVPCSPWTQVLVPHKKHIDQLIKHKSRRAAIVVWSAAGADWAEAVVRGLGLEQYVDLCVGKPTWVYDDLPLEEFMPKPKWYKDDMK